MPQCDLRLENYDYMVVMGVSVKQNYLHNAHIHIYVGVCIYIYAVELKTGPIFAFSSVKNWSMFFVFCF